MKIVTATRGDKSYVYLHTSRRVKGKKNPEVIKRYVGILDKGTGLVTPKKVPPEAFLAQIYDGEFTCQNLGGILIAKKVAEILGIREYLDYLFEEESKVVYALLLAISADPLHSSDYMMYVSKYYLGGITGDVALTAKGIHRALGDFQAKIPKISAYAQNVGERLVFVTDPNTLQHTMMGVATRTMMYIVTDRNGYPLFFHINTAGTNMAESLKNEASYINVAGTVPSTNTFVLSSPVPLGTLIVLMNDRVSFIMNADTMLDDESVLDRIFKELAGDLSVMEFDSLQYNVLEISMGIIRDGDGVNAVFGKSGHLKDALFVMRAAVWYDPKEYEEYMSDLSKVTSHWVDVLKDMRIDEARRYLDGDGIVSQFISVYENDNGSVGVRVHRKKRRQMAIRSSIHMFLSDHMSC